MPVPLRTTYHKAEAKYNVTTEFPSLGLHSAAATGNIGLVEYALDHGQPINSVLDGVLPLHAACAGGNEQVVKLLIDYGADVNAPRLPRRYSNDKNRDASAPIVGTSGSTPLHFAAANGNTQAVTLLLLHGAHANRSDKHGVTPEMLARQHGWLECADVLRKWVLDKDRDLKERPTALGEDSKTATATNENVWADGEPSMSSSTRRRIHMKHSIDTALNRLKSSSGETKLQLPLPSTNNMTATPPESPIKPLGEYTFHPATPSDDELHGSPVDGGLRRPSLPHILHPSSAGLSRSRKTSTPTLNQDPILQRPRSSGAGAENQEQEANNAVLGRPTGVRRLGSKYSLMNIFKKAQASEPGQSAESSQSIHGLSSSPAHGSTTALPLSTSPHMSSPLSNLSASSTNLHENPSSSVSISSFSRSGFRFNRGTDTPTRPTPQQSQTPQSLHRKTSANLHSPTAVDLHNAMAQQQQERQQNRDRSRSTGSRKPYSPDDTTKTTSSPGSSPLMGLLRSGGRKRDRSGSGGSLAGINLSPGHRGGAVFDEDLMAVGSEAGEVGRSSMRPSILRTHNRTSSSGQGSGSSSGFRALRFDSGSGGHDLTRKPDVEISRPLGLRSSISAGSLVHRKETGNSRINTGSVGVQDHLSPESASATVSNFELASERGVPHQDEDDEEFEYGEPLSYAETSHEIRVPTETKSHHHALLMRERGSSFASSDSSLSPIMTTESATIKGESTIVNADFPFSINNPPPLYPEEGDAQMLRVPSPGDGRGRGDSISSTSTSDSRGHPQLSASGTTSGSGGSDTVTTPWLASPGMDSFLGLPTQSSPGGNGNGIVFMGDIQDDGTDLKIIYRTSNVSTSLNERRSRIPSDINISSISSHAQAEALVQKVQQDIIEMAGDDVLPATGSTGRSPLSARLAAYGESLALERKLREQKEEQERQRNAEMLRLSALSKTEAITRDGTKTSTKVPSLRDGIERQHSLEHKTGRPRMKSRVKDPRRPSTAEGLSPSLSNDQMGRSHHSSRSASGFGLSPSSRLATSLDVDSEERDFFPSYSQSGSLPKTGREQDIPHRYPRSATHPPISGPDSDSGQLSRISSLEYPDTDTELGPSLHRVSTAPLSGPSPTRGKREVRSASKLTRMGFLPGEQAGRVPPPPPPGSKGIGAFKSLFQTIRGKP